MTRIHSARSAAPAGDFSVVRHRAAAAGMLLSDRPTNASVGPEPPWSIAKPSMPPLIVFDDLRDLLAKATPPRSGDRLAGIAADSAEQMIAARMALADVPLKQFLNEAVIPYEDDEVTRLIIDSHDAAGFAPISSLTVGGFRDWLLSDAATARRWQEVGARHHAGNGRCGLKADAQPGPDPGRQKMHGDDRAFATPSACRGG